MAAETGPDEKLIQLYVDLARAKSQSTEAVAGPYEIAEAAVDEYGLSETGIAALDDAWKIDYATRSIQAFLQTRSQVAAEQQLRTAERAREKALNEYLVSYIGHGIVVRQVSGKEPVIYSRQRGKFVREAQGRLASATALCPHENIFFDSYRWRILTAAGSYAPVLDPKTLEPLIAVERTD